MLSLKLESISKNFGARRVFSNINLEVRPGQCCGVVGPNGSGKSTLLKIASLLLSPTGGEIRFFSSDKELPAEKAHQEIFWIAPDLEFYGELTACENLTFFSKIRGIGDSRTEIIQQIEKVGLCKRENDRVSSFSTGMKQRLKFALALVSQPKILLLDEPGSNLDQQGVKFVDQFISEFKSNLVILLATNNPQETKYADFLLQLG